MTQHSSKAMRAALDPADLLKRGFRAQQGGDLGEAERVYRQVLQLVPNNLDALHLLGLVEKQRGRYDAAIDLIQRAIQQDPTVAFLHNNLGNAYREAGRFTEAERSYRQALTLQANYLDSHNNLGILLREQGQLDAAIAEFKAALAIDPHHADTLNNLGGALQKVGDPAAAAQCYQQALALDPELAVAHYNLGNLLTDLGDLPAALDHLQRAVSLKPDYVEAAVTLLRQLQNVCDWGATYRQLSQKVLAYGSEGSGSAVFPFAFLAIGSSLGQQQACARRWATQRYRPFLRERWAPAAGAPERRDGKRLRIGYLSSDFHNHATAYLMAEVFELHDREHFEIVAFSRGPDDGLDMRRRLVQAFDEFVDLRGVAIPEAAERIRAAEIDILVDLKGYTRDTGSAMLAARPAPIQVNYLGYPGTMGTPFVDYIIADRFVTPPAYAKYFDEQLAYLPDCYQPNDRQRSIAPCPGRAACGLPEEALVFACFNHTYKITPQVFEIWCDLLRQVPGSVLWLLRSNALAEANLLREAERAGVDRKRLVFAEELPLARHLARLRLADLFLDTHPYNAHTTASDALWAGVPVVTWAGSTFASRVAGSLLTAVGMPELIAGSPTQYRELALKLATQPAELSSVRARLCERQLTTPLFDSAATTRGLEALYRAMWARHAAGLPPAPLDARQELAKPTAPAGAERALSQTPSNGWAAGPDSPVKPFEFKYPVNLVHFWHDQHKPIFDEVIAALSGAFEDLGLDFTRSENALRPGAVNVLVGSTIFWGPRILDLVRGHVYIVYQLEQVSEGEGFIATRPYYLDLLRGARAVWDYSRTNIAALQSMSLAHLSYVPAGYHRVLETLRCDREKDIDVLFYGSVPPRRAQILQQLLARGLRVHASFAVYGKARDELIERAHIVINIHHFDGLSVLEEVRLSYLLANRCFVISETADHDPYDGGVVFCDYDQLVETCVRYLDSEPAVRAAIAERGYVAIRRLPMTDAVQEALVAMEPDPPPAAATVPLPGDARPVGTELLELVPRSAQQVLHIGCGAGLLGKALKDRQGCEVTGVEIVPEAARHAARQLDLVLCGNAFDVLPGLPDAHFDAVVMADVLEHIADHEGMLRLVRRKLEDAGRLVLSVPNVRHWSVIKGLLEGDWEYREEGILDRTHLRFYTRTSITRVLNRNGFAVEGTFATVMGEAMPSSLADALQSAGLALGDLLSDSQRYQYLLVCKKAPLPEG